MKYILLPATKSHCPRCGKEPRLLIRKSVTSSSPSPAFYICSCGFVGQVGVGPVEEEL